MTVQWALVRHIPDLRRQEPENVGIIVLTDRGHRLRVRGVSADGRIQGRSARWVESQDFLKGWLRHWQWQLEDPSVRVDSLLHQRAGDCIEVVMGGQAFPTDVEDPDAVADELFGELVSKNEVDGSTSPLRKRVDALIRDSGLASEPHFHFRYRMDTIEREEVRFPYAWANGHISVGEVLPVFRIDSVHKLLWIFSTLRKDVNKIVFTDEIPDEGNRAAELLEQRANLIVVPNADPQEVHDKFVAAAF